jgi:hypothetical protein
MKKKKLLGILAVLMVFALALTGCGQQSGEQNAGATGSESQNGTTAVDDGKNEGEVTAEPEGPDVGQVDNRKPVQDTDGNYIYTITVDNVQTEVKTCINVWDYITDDTPYAWVDLLKMTEDLGYYSTGVMDMIGYRFDREDGVIVGVAGTYDSDDYNLSTGERRVYELAVQPMIGGYPIMFDAGDEELSCADLVWSKNVISQEPFLIEGMDVYVSFDQIVIYAAMADYYRYNQVPLFRNSDRVDVNVP